MTNEQIIEGNKLIAEFMGWVWSDAFRGLLPDHWIDENGGCEGLKTELEFHSSWDELMPVVEKIEDMGYTFKICRRRIEIDKDGEHPPYPFIYSKLDTKIESAWVGCIEFIKWHNQNTSK
jgi:hypothetical protein